MSKRKGRSCGFPFSPQLPLSRPPTGEEGRLPSSFFFFLCKGVCLDVCLEVCVLVARKGHCVPWDYSDRRELPCGPWGLTPAPLGGGVWEGQYSLGKVPCDGEVAPEGVGREAGTTPSLGDPRGHLAMFDGFSGFPLS